MPKASKTDTVICNFGILLLSKIIFFNLLTKSSSICLRCNADITIVFYWYIYIYMEILTNNK